MGKDTGFDGEEQEADMSMVCTINFISRQLNPIDIGMLAKESQKDLIISAIMRYIKEGWPHTTNSKEVSHYRKLVDSLTTQSRCTPLDSCHSLSELLNGCQIQCKLDALLPSPAHAIHAVVTKVFGTQSVNICVSPRGLTWRRHIEQLCPRYGVEEDMEPGEAPTLPTLHRNNKQKQEEDDALRRVKGPNPMFGLPMMTDNQYELGNPRRSEWLRQRREVKIQHITSSNPLLAGRCYGGYAYNRLTRGLSVAPGVHQFSSA
ncbi:hypothetical protein O3P69_019059 [Scylla paramamosain]|uniref:Uncharacterized protein n=1 Tax=Scylla paramamosain TaxID=85552 RepID=A0AAW0T815_SCYPA